MILLLFFTVDQSVWRCVANVMRFTMLLAQGLLLGWLDPLKIAGCKNVQQCLWIETTSFFNIPGVML